jgi:MerR family transcriptional regulator, copper efflux regulator
MIQLWQGTAMMSLDEIRTILTGGTRDRDWREAVRDRIAICDDQLDRLTSARGYLSHMLECPSDHPADRCPYLAEQIDDYLGHLTGPRRDPSLDAAADTRQQRSTTPYARRR